MCAYPGKTKSGSFFLLFFYFKQGAKSITRHDNFSKEYRKDVRCLFFFFKWAAFVGVISVHAL